VESLQNAVDHHEGRSFCGRPPPGGVALPYASSTIVGGGGGGPRSAGTEFPLASSTVAAAAAAGACIPNPQAYMIQPSSTLSCDNFPPRNDARNNDPAGFHGTLAVVVLSLYFRVVFFLASLSPFFSNSGSSPFLLLLLLFLFIIYAVYLYCDLQTLLPISLIIYGIV